MHLLQLFVEALLYYLACAMLVRSSQDRPGLIRVFLVVLVLAFVSGGMKAVIGNFWLTSALVFVINFFILWLGLGIGFFRTIIAAILVIILRSIMEAVFASHSTGTHLLT
jgi:hypothetical protein